MNPFSKGKTVLTNPVSIVGDAAIAMHGVGEGRMIPLVILDTGERPEIVEYIRIHQFAGLGDVRVTWAQALNREDCVSLMLSFLRPMEFSFAILFELRKAHAILVEGVLRSGSLYLQAGSKGDRVSHTLDRPRVIIEVPDTGFRPHWQKICLVYLAQKVRASGVGRQEAKRLALEQYRLLQEMAAAKPFSA